MNYLKSVVVVEINKVLSDTIQVQGSQLITGCSACLRRDADSNIHQIEFIGIIQEQQQWVMFQLQK